MTNNWSGHPWCRSCKNRERRLKRWQSELLNKGNFRPTEEFHFFFLSFKSLEVNGNLQASLRLICVGLAHFPVKRLVQMKHVSTLPACEKGLFSYT